MKIEVNSYRNWDKKETQLFDVDYCKSFFKHQLTKNHHNTYKHDADGKLFDSQPDRLPRVKNLVDGMISEILAGNTLKLQENGLTYFFTIAKV